MKKNLITFLLATLTYVGFGQQWNAITSGTPDAVQTTLISSTENSIVVNVQIPGFYANEVSTPRGAANTITVPRAVSTFDAGEPNLPTTAIPAIVGDAQHYDIRVVKAQYADYNIEVAPSKGEFPRDTNPDDVPYTYGEAYAKDAFFPASQVGLYEPYILRDFRGQNMVVYPFAYNPISKTLRVYYDLTVEMYCDGGQGQNTITRKSNTVKSDPEMTAIYGNQFINFDKNQSRYTTIDEQGDLLIICHDAFISAMTPFVNWKKQIGRPTTIVGTSTAGNTDTAIKNYITEQYNANNNLTYVLLVGDVAQIPGHYFPSGYYSGKSDNWYGQIVGSDCYNDIFIGRFSAENTDHVTTQINKVIHYERDLNDTDTWCSTGIGVSKNEGLGGGHFGEADYQHVDFIRDTLLNYNYTNIHRDYTDVPGVTSSAAILSQHINDGASIINYCNHGIETAWGVFNYSNTNVNALTNVNKLPIIWSVACLTGKYDHEQTCFAETWLRANDGSPDSPTGAIGGMFSYIVQPWEPPMYGQDEMVDILAESYSDNIKRTLAGTSMNGNMKILDQFGQSPGAGYGTYMAWILYGDPTLTLRNATPANMNVTHASSFSSSSTSFTVNASNGNGALATLTCDNEIMGTATINNGTASITFAAPGQTGTATLTVFGYNKVTYIATINITSGGSPDPLTLQTTATPDIIAEGESSTLTAHAQGGNGTYTYNWSPATGLNNANSQTPTATPTQTTTYTCTVTCGSETTTANATVTVVKKPSNVVVVLGQHPIVTWNATQPYASFNVYRGSQLIASNITEKTYTDNAVTPCPLEEHCYSVAAVYNQIEAQSEEACATAELTLYPVENDEGKYQWNTEDEYGALLFWNTPSQNVNCWELTGFNIYREGAPEKAFEPIGNIPAVAGQNEYTYFDATQGGHYSYMVKAVYEKDEETRESDADLIEIMVTGIVETGDKIILYPNPTQGIITLEGEAVSHVRVVNTFGQTVFEAAVEGSPAKLDLSHLNKGMYLLHILCDERQSTKKIVLE